MHGYKSIEEVKKKRATDLCMNRKQKNTISGEMQKEFVVWFLFRLASCCLICDEKRYTATSNVCAQTYASTFNVWLRFCSSNNRTLSRSFSRCVRMAVCTHAEWTGCESERATEIKSQRATEREREQWRIVLVGARWWIFMFACRRPRTTGTQSLCALSLAILFTHNTANAQKQFTKRNEYTTEWTASRRPEANGTCEKERQNSERTSAKKMK